MTTGNPPRCATAPLRILQISDTHLFANPDGRLLGVQTLSLLQQVMEKARAEAGPVDLILATGDIAQDHSAAGYRLAARQLSSLGLPVHALPGNHDDPATMRQHLVQGLVSMPFAAGYGHWLLVLLDSSLRGSEKGHLSTESLAQLKATLAAHPESQVLVAVHHQPVPVGSPWLDTMMIDNAQALFDCLAQHPRVRCLVFGHVHQEFEASRQGMLLLASPATCFQFTRNQQHFGIDPLPPGCRLLQLYPDGRIETRVIRLATMPEGVQLASKGY